MRCTSAAHDEIEQDGQPGCGAATWAWWRLAGLEPASASDHNPGRVGGVRLARQQ